jgi:hypothetical protein
LYQAANIEAKFEAISIIMNLKFADRDTIVFNRATLIPVR